MRQSEALSDRRAGGEKVVRRFLPRGAASVHEPGSGVVAWWFSRASGPLRSLLRASGPRHDPSDLDRALGGCSRTGSTAYVRVDLWPRRGSSDPAPSELDQLGCCPQRSKLPPVARLPCFRSTQSSAERPSARRHPIRRELPHRALEGSPQGAGGICDTSPHAACWCRQIVCHRPRLANCH